MIRFRRATMWVRFRASERRAGVVGVLVVCALSLAGCWSGNASTRYAIAESGGTTTVTAPPVAPGTPVGFWVGGGGCLEGRDSLRIARISVHSGGWGLVVTDWGIRDRRLRGRFPQVPGAFQVGARHPLAYYGFRHAAFTTHCPQDRDEFIVVVARTGRGSGGPRASTSTSRTGRPRGSDSGWGCAAGPAATP